jgi:beta-N-acetylglucosaminidase
MVLLAGWLFRFQTAPAEPYFEGEAHLFYFSLLEKGFPHDYAKELTELHLLHPNWSFEPLMISQINAIYTWDHVIMQETKNPQTNLILADSTYEAYHHSDNSELYDSGYYQASIKTVEYFMDPRNFLNETDIFQFYDLSCHTESSIAEVESVLRGTFMEDQRLENGASYAEYFMQVGNALGINPVYLATKVRQEQGVNGSSPIISGSCGDRLADYYKNKTQTNENGKQVLAPSSGYTEEQLLALNGYYNIFNVKASGTGLFKIYYNAMNRAVEGTPEKADDWGGSPSWDTRWKSIWGGAYMLKKNYIDRYQSTLYLQKFNVDGRAADRNFWGQYMQNISGAMTESRTLYTAFASVDALDSSCSFLIPVYTGMPADPSADPANGECTILAQATNRYTYQIRQDSPSRLRADNYPIYQTLNVKRGKEIDISGSADHTYGVEAMQYCVDNGEWITLDTGKHFDFTLLTEQFSPNTLHILTVRGVAEYDHDVSNRKQNKYFLCAVYYINVTD